MQSDRVEVVTLTAGEGSLTLNRVFYISNLGVNLLSGNKLCTAGLLKSFNTKCIQLIDKQRKLVIELNRKRGVYYVSNIKGDHAYMAAVHTPPYSNESNFASNSTFFHEAEITNNAPVFLSFRNDNHMLWHRKVCYMGHVKLADILKVTDCESRV